MQVVKEGRIGVLFQVVNDHQVRNDIQRLANTHISSGCFHFWRQVQFLRQPEHNSFPGEIGR